LLLLLQNNNVKVDAPGTQVKTQTNEQGQSTTKVRSQHVLIASMPSAGHHASLREPCVKQHVPPQQQQQRAFNPHVTPAHIHIVWNPNIYTPAPL
jgi:hypothetical protein